MNTGAQKLVFAGTSRLTGIFPAFGARVLDASLRPLLGSRALGAMFARRNRAIMRRAMAFRRFLVIPDIHIGDAVLTQPALTAVASAVVSHLAGLAGTAPATRHRHAPDQAPE